MSTDQNRPALMSLVTLLKRPVLFVAGPLLFLYICYLPVLMRKGQGYRAGYWRQVKRACSFLLWCLNVKVRITPEARQALSRDTGSVIAMNHRSH